MAIGSIAYLLVSGLLVTVLPFGESLQWTVLAHTVLGVAMLIPIVAYGVGHWREYRRHAWSQATVLGWLSMLALGVALGSGLWLTAEAAWGIRTTPALRQIHWGSTWVLMAAMGFHVVQAWRRQARVARVEGARGMLVWSGGLTSVLVVGTLVWSMRKGASDYLNEFPSDYSYLYGTNRPFAPSLARTDTGGAFDARSLAGSHSCGTAGCHEEIVEEWQPSAHRYAAMDRVFLGIQDVMARENGAESTRYCGGCHDPISLFSGTKNIFVENLTGLHGYQEGISCLSCHAIRETDIKGNANYTVTQPVPYLWQWETNGWARSLRDFLIRSVPAEHQKLAKRSFKKPEYCAACHKQFIDEEINRVGWVQLQNQYDNWAASKWNHHGNAAKTIECRECHMPLVDSRDPASGDALDYNRSPDDRKHRSHRFLGANTIIPLLQSSELEGWEKHLSLTESWLKGEFEIPEIREKWAAGPIVRIAATAPVTVPEGQDIPLRVVMASNKVGHDFPTGPLDIIQSWLDLQMWDEHGERVWASGQRDARNFLQPGTFLFKAEPVDQHGNLIDRHNLWEMVGVRFRRALFPGHSDSVSFTIPCSGVGTTATGEGAGTAGEVAAEMDLDAPRVPAPRAAGTYRIDVALNYRKVDQFLLNHLFGETNAFTAPVTEIVRTNVTVRIVPKGQASRGSPGRDGLEAR